MQRIFQTMEQKRKCDFYLWKNHRKKHTACNWCQKNQEQEITQKWQVALCEDNIVILLWSHSQFPNPKSSESSFRCWIHLSLKATKSTHIPSSNFRHVFFKWALFCSSGPKSWTPKNSSQRLTGEKPPIKITFAGLGFTCAPRFLGVKNSNPLSFSCNTKPPTSSNPPKALSTPKREKSWPFHSAKPVWYWSTSCSEAWEKLEGGYLSHWKKTWNTFREILVIQKNGSL